MGRPPPTPVWATAGTAALALLLAWTTATGLLPWGVMWVAVALWPVALAAAVIAYRALGHGVSGRYVVARSGGLSRSTVARQRSAVSTVAIRESLLQRRLDRRTVSVRTAAGLDDVEGG